MDCSNVSRMPCVPCFKKFYSNNAGTQLSENNAVWSPAEGCLNCVNSLFFPDVKLSFFRASALQFWSVFNDVNTFIRRKLVHFLDAGVSECSLTASCSA